MFFFKLCCHAHTSFCWPMWRMRNLKLLIEVQKKNMLLLTLLLSLLPLSLLLLLLFL